MLGPIPAMALSMTPAPDRPPSALAALAAQVARWCADRRLAAGHQAFLDQIESDGELAAVLEATGATREELHAWAVSPVASEALLAHMLERLQLHTAALDGDARHALRRTCHGCAEWKTCRRWLETVAPERIAYRRFCPNARVFDALRARVT